MDGYVFSHPMPFTGFLPEPDDSMGIFSTVKLFLSSLVPHHIMLGSENKSITTHLKDKILLVQMINI
jgi:hypothetical protein